MLGFATAKINIGLKVLEKRADNYHQLDSFLYPIPLYDIIEIQAFHTDELIQTGIISTDKRSDNLVFRAVEKVRECYSVPSLKIHLHKQIPTESGLGGGSSDAVQVLQLLKAHFKLNISKERMWKMALELGSDCPFFIEGQAARVQGKGEVISPISLSLKGKYILMIKPEFSISTSDAFSKIIPHNSQVLNEEYLKDINQWQAHFVNDFEKVIGLQHPEIINIKEILLKNGAVYASLSGSGSAVYGIFNQLPTLRFPSDYFYWAGQLQ